MIRQHDHSSRSNERAQWLQRVKIERHIIDRSRQKARRRATRLIRFEDMAVCHAASRMNDICDRRSCWQEVDARRCDAARNGIRPQTNAPVLLSAAQHLWPLTANPRDPKKRFNIMHQGWAIEDAHLRYKRRPMARELRLYQVLAVRFSMPEPVQFW